MRGEVSVASFFSSADLLSHIMKNTVWSYSYRNDERPYRSVVLYQGQHGYIVYRPSYRGTHNAHYYWVKLHGGTLMEMHRYYLEVTSRATYQVCESYLTNYVRQATYACLEAELASIVEIVSYLEKPGEWVYQFLPQSLLCEYLFSPGSAEERFLAGLLLSGDTTRESVQKAIDIGEKVRRRTQARSERRELLWVGLN